MIGLASPLAFHGYISRYHVVSRIVSRSNTVPRDTSHRTMTILGGFGLFNGHVLFDRSSRTDGLMDGTANYRQFNMIRFLS